jgi:hypothetical protein
METERLCTPPHDEAVRLARVLIEWADCGPGSIPGDDIPEMQAIRDNTLKVCRALVALSAPQAGFPDRPTLTLAITPEGRLRAVEHGSLLVERPMYGFEEALLRRIALSETQASDWQPGDRRVVCAAVRDTNGTIICGPRHFDHIMHVQIAAHPKGSWNLAEQGFVDQFGEWLSREEAMHVALANGQILRRCGGDDRELFSENLY